jgi:hypothetical protein
MAERWTKKIFPRINTNTHEGKKLELLLPKQIREDSCRFVGKKNSVSCDLRGSKEK